MIHDLATSLILKGKREQEEEFFVNLFEHCNLNCPFCWQDHNSWEGIDTITSKAADIIDQLKKSPYKKVTINLMGGELFSDEVYDKYLEHYSNLVVQVE